MSLILPVTYGATHDRRIEKPFTPMILPPTDIDLSDNSRQVLHKRYLRKGLDGQPVETIPGMFRRVARAVAEPDAAHGYDVASTEEAFYGLLTSLRFFPNSPTFTGAGTPLGQLAACFVLPISDDMGKRSDGIFQTLRDAALIQQTGGGNGFSFSRLRPKGDCVATSAGVATGPVGFLRTYDGAFGEVAQGGTRRGANMAVLRVDHPDIEQFVSCKAKEGEITNFNISVGITDAFMQAVEDDADFPLINPRDGKVWRTLRARELFDKIVTFAHHNGEPGALFLDAANRSNPVPHLYELEATNPCGEQWLGPYENCCLGSINLAQHVTQDHRVDWAKLRESIDRGDPLPRQRGRCQQVRPGGAATARGRAAGAPHRPGHHGAGRPDVLRWACATVRRRARSSRPRSWNSCAITAWRPASRWPRNAAPSRRFRAASTILMISNGRRRAAHAVCARLGPPRPRLG